MPKDEIIVVVAVPTPTPPPLHNTSPRFAAGVSTLPPIDSLPGPEDSPGPISIRSGGRQVRFVGQLLARVSSERPRAPRWTELEIFRTESGQYVVHRVGVSRVVHDGACETAIANHLPLGAEFPEAPPDPTTFYPCPICSPSLVDPSPVERRATTLRFERERHWAGVADTPEDAVSMLYRRDGGMRSLPWTSTDLLAKAGEHDPRIAAAWAVENV